jgi:hypothetical protein
MADFATRTFTVDLFKSVENKIGYEVWKILDMRI